MPRLAQRGVAVDLEQRDGRVVLFETLQLRRDLVGALRERGHFQLA